MTAPRPSALLVLLLLANLPLVGLARGDAVAGDSTSGARDVADATTVLTVGNPIRVLHWNSSTADAAVAYPENASLSYNSTLDLTMTAIDNARGATAVDLAAGTTYQLAAPSGARVGSAVSPQADLEHCGWSAQKVAAYDATTTSAAEQSALAAYMAPCEPAAFANLTFVHAVLNESGAWTVVNATSGASVARFQVAPKIGETTVALSRTSATYAPTVPGGFFFTITAEDAAGAPRSGATVTIFPPISGLANGATTDASGTATILQGGTPPAGTYLVNVSANVAGSGAADVKGQANLTIDAAPLSMAWNESAADPGSQTVVSFTPLLPPDAANVVTPVFQAGSSFLSSPQHAFNLSVTYPDGSIAWAASTATTGNQSFASALSGCYNASSRLWYGANWLYGGPGSGGSSCPLNVSGRLVSQLTVGVGQDARVSFAPGTNAWFGGTYTFGLTLDAVATSPDNRASEYAGATGFAPARSGNSCTTVDTESWTCGFSCIPGDTIYVWANDTAGNPGDYPSVEGTCGGADAGCQANLQCSATSGTTASSSAMGTCSLLTSATSGTCIATQPPPSCGAPYAVLSPFSQRGEAPYAAGFSLRGFADSMCGLASWSLDFGDGSGPASGTDLPPSFLRHTYGAGPHVATLSVAQSDGQSAQASASVDVSYTWVRLALTENGGAAGSLAVLPTAQNALQTHTLALNVTGSSVFSHPLCESDADGGQALARSDCRNLNAGGAAPTTTDESNYVENVTVSGAVLTGANPGLVGTPAGNTRGAYNYMTYDATAGIVTIYNVVPTGSGNVVFDVDWPGVGWGNVTVPTSGGAALALSTPAIPQDEAALFTASVEDPFGNLVTTAQVTCIYEDGTTSLSNLAGSACLGAGIHGTGAPGLGQGGVYDLNVTSQAMQSVILQARVQPPGGGQASYALARLQVTSPRLAVTPSAAQVTVGDPVTIHVAQVGQPVAGASVAIMQGATTVASLVTDAEGNVVVSGLPAGSYQVVATLGDLQSSASFDVVPPFVDRAPTVVIVSPASGSIVRGVATIAGNASDPDGQPVAVRVRVDGGAWQGANGAEGWTFLLDTTTLRDGAHEIEAQATDGELGSTIDAIQVVARNAPPAIAITSPAAGESVQGRFLVGGEASQAEGSIASVEISLDAGAWRAANGTGPWSTALDVSGLRNGEHTLAARATDDAGNRATTQETILVANAPRVSILAPGFLAVEAGVVLVEGAAQGSGSGPLVVELRADEGAWQPVSGDASWLRYVDTAALADGVHDLAARATQDGLVSPVALVQVRTANGAPPALAIDAPGNRSTVGGLVAVSGRAFAPQGHVARVEWSSGGAMQTAFGLESWSFTYDARAAGPRGAATLFVRATDDAGRQTGALLALTIDNRADAAIAPADITVERAPIETDFGSVPNCVTEHRLVHVVVHNLGASATTAGSVMLTMRAGSTTRLVGDAALPALAPGGSAEVVIVWDTTGTVGDVTLTARAFVPDAQRSLANDAADVAQHVLVGGLGFGVTT